MRFLVVHPGPEFSVHDLYVGWLEALRELGQQVLEFNLNDRLCLYDHSYIKVGESTFRKALTPDQVAELAVNGLYAALYRTHPDVLLVISGFLIPGDLLDLARRRGTRVVVVHTESPYEDERQIELAAHADLNLINDPINIDQFRAVAPTEYMPQAYRPSIHHPGPADPDLACDLAFVGTGFESRINFFEAMNLDGLDVLLAGNWQRTAEDSPLRKHLAHDISECVDNTETARIYRSAAVGLNLYRREAEAAHLAAGWACGPREIEMAACGMFFLRDSRPEGDKLLGMLPTFTDPQDASEQLRWWLARPAEREKAAAQAREAVADHTFTAHAAALLRLLDS